MAVWSNEYTGMMDYNELIHSAIEFLKQDKRIVQPYRNYAIKELVIAQSLIQTGLTTTNRKPDDPAPMQFAGPEQRQCICRDGMPPRKDCPMHGDKG